MGAFLTAHTTDGHVLDVYEAQPKEIKAGLIIIQEIFGVNHHIQSVADRFAEAGFYVLAPSLFDRVQKNVQMNYADADFKNGFALVNRLDWNLIFKDIKATVDLMHALIKGKVGIVGYCWGGTVAWRSASHLDMDAAVCYYGGNIYDFKQETPRCPTLLHFGEKDTYIPQNNVKEIQAANPDVQVFLYNADHAFNCDERGNYDAKSAKIAQQRTLEFFSQHLTK